jgi:predicted N-acyltransferase
MAVRVLNSLSDIPAAEWNALAGDANPFLRHEFLYALEQSGCTGGASGWTAQHLIATDDAGHLAGAVPLYRKDHSYGEYVFDWAWANAYARAGLEYYPKLVAAVPFSPVTGPRLLLSPATGREAVAGALIDAALEQARAARASSLHWLFTSESDTCLLESRGFQRRAGYQFHWSNPGYRDFDDFLSTLTAEKRKKLKRERRAVREAGVTVELVEGDRLHPADWDRCYEFYRSTVQAHGAIAYLTRAFFHALGTALPQHTLMALARRGESVIGGALFLRGTDTLYGRYWGTTRHVPGLHFETCYYAPMEYCIARGLQRFEAGAQGEHKLARGFVPTPTYSVHWLAHPAFARAVGDFLTREQAGMEYEMHELNEHAPFKRERIGVNSDTGRP